MEQEQIDKLDIRIGALAAKLEWACQQVDGLLHRKPALKKWTLSDGTPIDKFFICRRSVTPRRTNLVSSREVDFTGRRKRSDYRRWPHSFCAPDTVDRRQHSFPFRYQTSRDFRIQLLDRRKP